MNPRRVQKSGALRTASGADAEAKYQDQLSADLSSADSMHTEPREGVSPPNVISCAAGRTRAVLLRCMQLALGTFQGCGEISRNPSLYSRIIVGSVQWGQSMIK